MSSTQKLLNPAPDNSKITYGYDFGSDQDYLVETKSEIDKDGNVTILSHKIIEP